MVALNQKKSTDDQFTEDGGQKGGQTSGDGGRKGGQSSDLDQDQSKNQAENIGGMYEDEEDAIGR